MAQFVLINAIGTRRAGEVLDSVQDGQAVITQLAAFGGVLVPLPNATLQPYIDAAQLAYDRADSTQAQNIMLAGYASTTAIAGGGTAGKVPLWTSASGLGDSAITQVAGSILSLTSLVGGAGYASTSTAIVALGSGSGTGATAQIVTSGGAVTWVALKDPGSGYTPGDVLTIPGGTGTITVLAVVPKNDASGHFTAQRIGAGTAQPRAGVDSRFGASISGFQTNAVEFRSGATATFQALQFNNFAGAPPTTTSTSVYSSGHSLNLDLSAFAPGSASVIGQNHWINVTSSSGAGSHSLAGVITAVQRSYAGDTNTNFSMTAGSFSANHANNAYTTGTVTGVSGSIQSFSGASGTIATSRNFGAFTSFASPVTVTDHHAFDTTAFTLSSGAVITNLYGLRLRAYTFTAPSVVPVAYWGVSQEDARAKSRFFGNVGVGDSLDVGAGKVIASLTLTNGGTGYTSATYSQVALTTVTGTGSGATADIVVAGGIVTTVVLRAPGQGYAVGDTLSCASIGAGSNFLLTVATTASILRSDGTSVATRVGAGTTTPRASFDAANGVMISGTGSMIEQSWSGSFVNTNIAAYIGGSVTPNTIYRGLIVDTLVNTTSMAAQVTSGLYAGLKNTNSASGTTTNLTGVTSALYRSYANDLSTTANVTGFSAVLGTRSGVGSVTSGAYTFYTGNLFHTVAGHTFTSLTWYDAQPGTLTGNVTTSYLLRGRAFAGAGTITNRWAISQEDALAKSTHYGNFGVGNALDVGAGKIIASLTLTNAGAGATNGTYSQVALTGGSGTGATADIVVAGNVVTVLTLRNPGQGYIVGDTLSTAAIGGAGFVFTVATTASILRSDGTSVAARIGGGTTTPRSSLDIIDGAVFDGFFRATWWNTATTNPVSSFMTLAVGNRATANVLPSNSSYAAIRANPWLDLTNITTQNIIGVHGAPIVTQSVVGGGWALAGLSSAVYRTEANDLSTTAILYGVASNVGTQTGVGSATTSTLTAFNSFIGNNNATHTVTTLNGINFSPSASGAITTFTGFRLQAVSGTGTITTFYGLRLEASTTPTITNRYPIAQEDTLGANYVRAKTFFGAAVGTAAATTASVEITAQGTLNGDLRLNSANAVVDVSAASSNGVRFNNRGGAGITSTTQLNYEEGTYTPTLSAGWTATAGNYSGTWTRNGRLVTLTIQFTGGTNSGATGGSTISTPVGLTPVRNGAGTAVNANGTALGNGVVVVTTGATIINANAITTTTVDKTIVVQYEV